MIRHITTPPPTFRPVLLALLLLSILALAALLSLTLPAPDADAASNAPPADALTPLPQQGGGDDGAPPPDGDCGPDDDYCEEEGGAGAAAEGGASAADGATAATRLERRFNYPFAVGGHDQALWRSDEPLDLAVAIEDYSSTSIFITTVFWVVWAENRGSEEVHGVEVLLDRANPITGKVYYEFEDRSSRNYIASYSLSNVYDQSDLDYAELGSGKGLWRVGTLPPGSRIGIGLEPEWEWTGTTNDEPPGTDDDWVNGPLRAEIYSSRVREDARLLYNNRDRAALGLKKTGSSNNVSLTRFDGLLEAKADNLRPANKDNQAVNFTLRMRNDLKGRASGYDYLLYDVTLDITLSGLKVKTAPTTTELDGTTINCKDSGTATDTLGSCAEGDDYAQWDAGILVDDGDNDCATTGATTDYKCRELILKLALDGDMPLEERCLEASMRSIPGRDDRQSWFSAASQTITFPESWQGGPVKVCLGADDPPRLLLEDGRADLFTYYPCVDAPNDEVADALVTSYPCDGTDTMEVAAAIEHPSAVSRRSDFFGDLANSRAYDRHSGKAIVKTGYTQAGSKVNAPETLVTVQVKDPSGRAYDSHTTSVNGSSAVSWHTARTSSGGSTGISGEIPGVWVGENYLPVTAQQFTGNPRYNWGPTIRIISVSGLGDASNPLPTPHYSSCVDPEAITSHGSIDNSNSKVSGLPDLPVPPGVMAFRRQSGAAYQDIKNSATTRHGRILSFTNRSSRFTTYDRVLEFEKLGTYVVDYHFTAQYTRTPKTGNDYCSTARYVFHVGPVADLEVTAEKAGSSYTVTAQNHGPEPAENAQVKLNVTGVTNAKASVGCFDASTGVWGLSQEWNATDSKCEDQPYTRLPGADDPRFHPGDEATLTFTGSYNSLTADIYNQEQCVNAAGAVQTATTELACIYSDTTTTPPTRSGNHWGSYPVCVDEKDISAQDHNYNWHHRKLAVDYVRTVNNVRQPVANENQCKLTAQGGDSGNTFDLGTVYDYDELNNSVTLGVPPGQVGVITAGRQTGQNADENKIDLSWTAPTSPSLPKATHYDVEYQSRTGNSGSWGSVWTRAATEIADTSYTFENAGGGTSYRFQVRAVTASNPDNLEGSWRASGPVATVSSPDQVGNLTAARGLDNQGNIDDTKIKVSWTPPTSGTNASTTYEIERKEDGGAWVSAKTGHTATLVDGKISYTYTDTAGTGNNSHRFRVQAVTVSGGDTIRGSWRESNTVSKMTAPGQVGTVTATRQKNDDTKIDVEWTAPTSGETPTGYNVQYKQDDGAWTDSPGTTTIGQDKITHLLEGADGQGNYVAGGSKYVFQVQAYASTTSGNNLTGSWRSSSTVKGEKAGKVTGLTATRWTSGAPDPKSTTIRVTWTAAARATEGYDVQYRKDNGSWQSDLNGLLSASTTTYTQANADGVEKYTFRVRGVSKTGPGPWEESDKVNQPPVEYNGHEAGVDYITLKMTSGPWWYEHRNHYGDWTSCTRVAAGGTLSLTGLRPDSTHVVKLYTESGCSESSGYLGRKTIATLSEVGNWNKCWNTDDCRHVDGTDFNNHTHKRTHLHNLGATLSGCDWNTRTQHSHDWHVGYISGQHWHCHTSSYYSSAGAGGQSPGSQPGGNPADAGASGSGAGGQAGGASASSGQQSAPTQEASSYDQNGDGSISRDEALAALADYFAGNASRETATAVVMMYFASGS